MGWAQWKDLPSIQAACQAIVATPALDDGTGPVIVYWTATATVAQNPVTYSQGADGTYILSFPALESQALQDWFTAQAFSGWVGCGSGDRPPGWTPYSPPLP